jgi:chromosome partitioning protein
MTPTLVITVANLKGGTTKTTSSALLLHGLAARGYRVLGVDADPPASLLRWAELGGWELPVIGLPTKALHTRLPGLAAGYDAVVIDTPPLDDQAGIVYSALRAADVTLVPVSPTMMELDRLSPILDAVEQVSPLRTTPMVVRVLLTRTVSRANSTSAARTAISEVGVEVMTTEVGRLEAYAQAFGTIPAVVTGDPYDLAVAELLAAVAAQDEAVRNPS